MKQKVRRHQQNSRVRIVGSEEASLQKPSGGLPCSPPLCHPVAEGWLASMGWIASGGHLEAAGTMFVEHAIAGCQWANGGHQQLAVAYVRLVPYVITVAHSGFVTTPLIY